MIRNMNLAKRIIPFLSVVVMSCNSGNHINPDSGQLDGENDGDADTSSSCEPCMPQCEGKVCGDDGCGWVCGTCSGDRPCVSHHCGAIDGDSCINMNCGNDYVSGYYCGACPDDWSCSMYSRSCTPDGGGCDGIPPGGMCINGSLVTCREDNVYTSFCDFKECVDSSGNEEAHCLEVPCLPSCFGRICGDDGCGGSCGICGVGKSCDSDLGICLPGEPGCGRFKDNDVCAGHVRIVCKEDEIEVSPCLPQGKICMTDSEGRNPSCCQVQPGIECSGDVPEWGHCEEDHLYYCDNAQLKVVHCRLLGHGDCIRDELMSYGCVIPVY